VHRVPEATSARDSIGASYLTALRARWVVVAVVAAVCVAVAAVLVVRAPNRYTSSADILVTPISSADDAFVGVQVLRDSVVAPSSNVLTVARLVKTPGTAALVARQPNFRSSSPASLLSSVSVSPLSQTSIVVVSATASSPDRAASLANSFANATIARRTAAFQASLRPAVARLTTQVDTLRSKATSSAERAALEGRLAELQPLVGASDPTVAVLNPAAPPATTSGPSPALVLPAALVGGLLLGLLVALACELVDRRVRREDDLDFGADIPILARVPAAAERSRAVAATTFRDLRTRLFDGDPETTPRSILVASADRGDGKTAVAIQLTGSLAAIGRRVALFDCDFEQPSIAARFGVDAPGNGFEELFNGAVSKGIVRPDGPRGKLLLALPTIRKGSQRARFDTKAARFALGRLAKLADVVIVDSSAAMSGSDALLLAKATDATVIAVRLGHTRQADVDRLARRLREHGVHATGVVVLTGGTHRVRGWIQAAVAKAGSRTQAPAPKTVRRARATGRPATRSAATVQPAKATAAPPQ